MGKNGPNLTIDFLAAIQETAEVENALIEGYPATVLIGSHRRKSALRIAAERMNVDPQSLRSRIGTPERPGSIWRHYHIAVEWSLYKPPAVPEWKPPEDDTPIDESEAIKERQIIGLKDEVARLSRALRDSHREANTEDILRDIIGGIAGAARNIPEWVSKQPQKKKGVPDPEVPVTMWADWHIGEVVERDEINGINEYNMDIAERRINHLVDTTIKLCRDYHTGSYPGIVINLTGDFISGGIHPELKATDEEEVIPACLKTIDWLIASITRMADHFKSIYLPCVAGNHGRNTAKPEFKRYYKKNFDWLIYQIVAKHFADDKRITFDIRPSNDVLYRVYNIRYLLVHGDMLGTKGGDGIIGSIGPIMRGEVKKSGQSSAVGQSFDKILMGHWHQDLWLPRATVSNTLKGFDEYARLQLGAKPTTPSQPLWFVHHSHGQTAHRNINVDVPISNAPQPWVSIFDIDGKE